jgi:archaellum component FlaC
VRKILLSNDVEVNPGPTEGQNEKVAPQTMTGDKQGGEGVGGAHETGPITMSDIMQAIQQQGNFFREETEKLKLELKAQSDQHNAAIKGELGEIKKDLKKVSDKCEEINQRCNRLESENIKMCSNMEAIAKEVCDLHVDSEERKDENARLTAMVGELQEEVGKMNSEIDRLEEFSRRDNLRMFGVTSVSDSERESYDDCCAAVCSVLNSVDTTREWTDQDIVRAHRVGRARSGQPQPMIVKFRQWRHKMRLITDKPFRANLEREGVRVVNDLTRRQMDTVAEAKREGKAAYFVKGKLTIGPKRSDPRNYRDSLPMVAGAGETDTSASVSSPVQPSFSLPPPQRHPPLSSGDVRGDRSRDSPSASGVSQQGARETGEPRSRAASQSVTDTRHTTGGARSRATDAPSSVSGPGKQSAISGYLRGQATLSRLAAGGGTTGRTLRSSVDNKKK